MTSYASLITLDGYRCVRSGASYGDAYRKANSYRCPVGPWPGRAFVLMHRVDAEAAAAATTHTLKMTCNRAELEIPDLYWVGDHRIGKRTDALGVYLVELADKRILAARWSDTGDYVANLRGGARDYTDPYVAGDGETWQDVITSLWPSTLYGSAPTLPYTPTGDPEVQFHGVNAWFAMHAVLDAIGCTTAFNPLDGTFSIVRRGEAQAIPTPSNLLLYDADPLDGSKIDAPRTAKLYFPAWSEQFGCEADTDDDGANWIDGPPHTVEDDEVDADAPAGTVVPQWSDIAAVDEYDGTDRNSSDRAAILAERIESLQLDADTPSTLKRYAGLVTDILPGAQVKIVQWRNWEDQTGTVTEYVTQSGDPMPRDAGPLELRKAEPWQAPDYGRRTHPVWPRVTHVVKINAAGASAGDIVAPDATTKLHSGKLVRHDYDGATDIDDVWIRFIDNYSVIGGNIRAMQGQQYVGRLAGVAVVSSVKRPLYLCKRGLQRYVGKASGTITAAADGSSITYGSGTVQVHDDSGAPVSGFTLTAKNSMTSVIADTTIVHVGQKHEGGEFFAEAANCGSA